MMAYATQHPSHVEERPSAFGRRARGISSLLPAAALEEPLGRAVQRPAPAPADIPGRPGGDAVLRDRRNGHVPRRYHRILEVRVEIAGVHRGKPRLPLRLFTREVPERPGRPVVLRRLASMPDLQGRMLFFYLDAHWRDDLPLREEVEIISTHWPDALVMVDDFAVPDDPGYGYADYGEGRALTLELIRPALRASPAVYFPAAPSAAETGSRRGCVVLAF